MAKTLLPSNGPDWQTIIHHVFSTSPPPARSSWWVSTNAQPIRRIAPTEDIILLPTLGPTISLHRTLTTDVPNIKQPPNRPSLSPKNLAPSRGQSSASAHCHNHEHTSPACPPLTPALRYRHALVQETTRGHGCPATPMPGQVLHIPGSEEKSVLHSP